MTLWYHQQWQQTVASSPDELQQ